MYDENALYDELAGFVRNTGHNVKSAIDIVQYINRLTGGSGNMPSATGQLATTDTSFEFTGQSTDLRYFADHREMPISMIENIPDENLKNAVKEEFNKAAAAGRIEISPQSGRITITDSGREYISRPEFRAAAARDAAERAQASAQTMGFELDGTVHDLGIFNYSDSLNLTDILASPDKETVGKVLENLVQLKDNGLITVENGKALITDKGRQIINTDLFKAAAGNKVSATAAAGVPGKIIVAIKTAAQAAQSLSSMGQ